VADRVNRIAKTVADCPELKPYLFDVVKEVHAAKNVLLEGSQGFMLSVLYGTYPFVTSKDVSASTIAADVGMGPKDIDDVIMVIKSYTTRVGAGNLTNEVTKDAAEKLGMQEYGTVTGRPRRTSLDLHYEDLKFACQINSTTQMAITKLDVKFPGCAGKRKFTDLTKEAQSFVKDVESKLKVPVTLMGTGKDTEDIVDRRN
ncbi:MAG: adenylosuccinate synthetase, partial [Candidatus Micrarchaeota archaeon]|nr:adenylosuccinate synthetase [Candidatus Micrarchaeota archaeon]